MRHARAAPALAVGQGACHVSTGRWPLVHLPSFEAVTARGASAGS